ncbi:MAG: ATP-binding protein [Solirubrobacteraceae bacterium]
MTGADTSVGDIPNVVLSLSNKAENVLLVRQTLSGLAEAIDLDPIELNDLSTAVSEACNNVVLHAYEGEEGPLEVEIFASSPTVEVVVRDRGTGIRPREVDPDEEVAGGIGLPVIRALTRDVELRELDGGGTEVRMRFDTAHANPLQLDEGEGDVEPLSIPGAAYGSSDALTFTVGPTSLARAVLPRVLCALAARAYFSTDRISDTQLVSDALVAQAEDSFSASRVNVEVELKPRDLQLRIGPLRAGHAETVLQATSVDGLGSVLERLADGHDVSREGATETLALRLAEREQR